MPELNGIEFIDGLKSFRAVVRKQAISGPAKLTETDALGIRYWRMEICIVESYAF